MSEKLKELLEIQKRIESDKIAQIKIQGKIEALKEKLFDAFTGCTSVQEIKERLIKQQKEIENKEKKLTKQTNSIISEFQELTLT